MQLTSIPPLRHLLPTVAGFILTAVLATLAFGTLTPIWYSNAIAVVALALHPPRRWPWFLLPIWLADASITSTLGHGPPLLLSLANQLEIVLAAGLLRASGGIRFPLFEGRQMLRVCAVSLLVPVASATCAAAALAHGGAIFQPAWRAWYSASALGLVTVVPFLLCWTDPGLRLQAFDRVTRRSVLLLVAGTLAAAWLVQSDSNQALIFLSFPAVFALTWAFGLGGATLGMIAVSASVLWATLEGHGSIVHMLAGETLAVQIEAAQLYLASVLLSSLPLAMLRAQQQELQAGLRRAGEARTEFLAAMSHEIRTPMTGVLGMVDLLASEPLPERQQRYVEALRSSGRHLLSVINDILDFTRIESGRLELEEIDFPLGEVLERVRSLAQPLAVERGLRLHVDGDDAHPQRLLRGDPFRLQQVLLNLVSNAIKFTEQGGVSVTVAHGRGAAGEHRVAFEVRDTGVGIAPEKLAHLFQPFTQADRSISRQYGGSGLGLAISRRLVEAMGGGMSVSSVPGEGSVFRFEVPLKPGVQRAAGPQPHAETLEVPPQRILVAEDVEINRELLRTALGRRGHELTFARNGAEAVRLVKHQEFDLVLMDVQMPVMDGVEATRRIRGLPAPKGQVPIVGLTANVMARERERYLAAGMDDCLNKPIDWDLLAAVIARLGDRSGTAVATGAALEEVVEIASVELEQEAAAGDATADLGADAASLLDENALGALRRMASDADVAEWMRVGIAGYAEACEAMEHADASPGTIAQHAHRVKGSAGTLGLAAVHVLARRIEAAAEEGRMPRELLSQLRPAVAATRAELERRGLLHEASTT